MAGTDQNHSLSERSHLQTIQDINNSPELVSRVAASVSRWIQMCMEAVNPDIITKQGLFLIAAHAAHVKYSHKKQLYYQNPHRK